MTFKLIQTLAVVSLVTLSIACTLVHCPWAALSLGLSAAYIGTQDDDELEDDEESEEAA